MFYWKTKTRRKHDKILERNFNEDDCSSLFCMNMIIVLFSNVRIISYFFGVVLSFLGVENLSYIFQATFTKKTYEIKWDWEAVASILVYCSGRSESGGGRDPEYPPGGRQDCGGQAPRRLGDHSSQVYTLSGLGPRYGNNIAFSLMSLWAMTKRKCRECDSSAYTLVNNWTLVKIK